MPANKGQRGASRNKKKPSIGGQIVVLTAVASFLVWTLWGRHGQLHSDGSGNSRPKREGAAVYRSTDAQHIPDDGPERAGQKYLPKLRPHQAPGSRMVVELSEPPEEFYGALQESGADELYRKLLGDIGRDDAEYDPNLARAARELAYQYSLNGAHPPPDAIEFLVHASGAIDSNLSSRITRTSSQDREVLEEALDRALRAHAPGPQTLRVGMGEIFVPGSAVERFVGIVISRRSATIEPIARRIYLGDDWTLEGTLDRRFHDLHGQVLYPSGLLMDLEVEFSGDTFTASVETEFEDGVLLVEISGVGPTGPGKILQVPLFIDAPLPDRLETVIPPDERHIRTVAQAERRAFDLLNADRVRADLATLIWDPALRPISRSHSEDMMTHPFFGHLSPNTGLVSDRLAAAGYVSMTYGENLAHHASLYSAQQALMRSLGHRINILNPRFTHAATGVAIQGEGEDRRWYLTQVFATPPQPIDPVMARVEILNKIQQGRDREGLRPLRPDRGLTLAAQGVAQRLADGYEDASPRAALDAAELRDALRGRSNAWTATVSKPGDFKIPPGVHRASANRVGLGLAQANLDEGGSIAVVLLISQ